MKTLVKKPGTAKSLATIQKQKKLADKSEAKAKKAKKIAKVNEVVADETILKPVKSKKSEKKLKSKNNEENDTKEIATKMSKVSTKAGKKNVDKKKSKTKKSHKEDLEGLKDIDPEFYDFLKKNDKQLLEFNLLDSDDDEEEQEGIEQKSKSKSKKEKKSSKSLDSDDEEEMDYDDDDDDSENGEEEMDDDNKFHKPSDQLEVASDESDFEDEEEPEVATDGTQKVTLNLLRQWQIQLENNKVPIDIVRKVTQAFSSALASITPDADQVQMTYKVVGSAAFNGVIQLCVLHLQPAILRFLGVKEKSSIPLHKTKKWNKVRGCLRYYLTDLIRLVEQVSSSNILSVLLKHLHQMANMVAPFTALGKTILKRLIVLWSTGDETIRVVAFLCILKITRNQQVSCWLQKTYR